MELFTADVVKGKIIFSQKEWVKILKDGSTKV